MFTTDAIIARIRAYRRAQGLSKRALALQAGLAPTTLAGLDEPNWGANLTTLRKLEALIPEDFRPEPEPEEDAA